MDNEAGDIIAEIALEKVHREGDRSDVLITIHKPIMCNKGINCICRVESNGLELFNWPRDFQGVDSFHAIWLVTDFIKKILVLEAANGSVFWWHGQPIDLEKVFPPRALSPDGQAD